MGSATYFGQMKEGVCTPVTNLPTAPILTTALTTTAVTTTVLTIAITSGSSICWLWESRTGTLRKGYVLPPLLRLINLANNCIVTAHPAPPRKTSKLIPNPIICRNLQSSSEIIHWIFRLPLHSGCFRPFPLLSVCFRQFLFCSI